MESLQQLVRKHKGLIACMILLVTCCVYLIGILISQGKDTKESIDDYQDTYGKKTYYYTNENIQDKIYYEYLAEENQTDIKHIENFLKKLQNEQEFSYVIISDQFLELEQNASEIFLYGYESGDSESSIYQWEGKTYYYTKCLQVSEAFFQEYNVKISEGKGFNHEDYILKKGQVIPILLGNSYKDFYQVGDTFSGEYLFKSFTWQVVGFVDEKTFFYNRATNSFESCERYIIMPAFVVEGTDEFSKMLCISQLRGEIISDIGYPNVERRFMELLEEENLQNWNIFIQDPKASDVNDLISTYSAMTKEVQQQFEFILVITVIFAVVSISSVLCGFIREKHQEYGIKMLCGASSWKILEDIILLDCGIVFTGGSLAILGMLVSQVSLVGIIGAFFVGIVIGILVMTVSYHYFCSMDIHEIIGGRE